MEIAVVESPAGAKTVSGRFGNDCRRGAISFHRVRA